MVILLNQEIIQNILKKNTMSKLIVNTSNFSAFFSSNSEAPINEIVRKNVITPKDGCNQIIKSTSISITKLKDEK